ncbi:MAG: MmcQ/YjbR family DNA-binding protein [Acidimicrobiia bacterium]|nr:MmcQ/YjbR family DNA-binding protein [Acidimicrobiia bacterium]
MLDHDDIREIALSLPGAYEQASFGGRPSFRTKPRMFCWIREDPEALMVFLDSLEDKEMLLASDPDTFFTTPHYDGYAAILVNLDALEADEARELVTDSWRLRAPKKLVKEFDSEHPPPRTD